MNGNLKEASDCRRTGIFVTWGSEEKKAQSRQGRSELGNVFIIQFEDALTASAVGRYLQVDKVPKCLNHGGEGGIDDGIGKFCDVQGM